MTGPTTAGDSSATTTASDLSATAETTAERANRRASGGRGDVRVALRIARTDVRRQVRRALARPRRTATQALLFAVLWANLLFAGGHAPTEPSAVAAFDRYAGGVAALGWAAVTATAALSATTSVDDLDAGDLVVPAAGVRAAFVGTLLADHARRLVIFGAFGLFTVGTVALGTGSTRSLPYGALAVLCVLATAELTGHALALGWKRAVGSDPLGGRGRVLLGGVGALVLALALRRVEAVVAAVAGTPPAWFGDLFLLGVPGGHGDPIRAALALATTAVAVPGLYLLAERLARTTWFEDEPPGQSASAGGLVPVDAVFSLVAARPTRAVAWRVWLQTVRRPKTLVFVGIPVLLGATVVFGGEAPPAFPLLLGVYGAWAAGVGTTLNPLSTEGVALPLLLTSPAAGRGVVRGYVAASAAVAVPVVTLVVAVGGLASGFGPVETAAATATSVALVVGTAPLSVAIGVGVPRIGALRPSAADGPLTPSKFAFVGYSLAVGLFAAPAVVAAFLVATGADPRLAAVGMAVTVGLATVAGLSGYVYAGRRFARLTLN